MLDAIVTDVSNIVTNDVLDLTASAGSQRRGTCHSLSWKRGIGCFHPGEPRMSMARAHLT
jgi:hypothetical protein